MAAWATLCVQPELISAIASGEPSNLTHGPYLDPSNGSDTAGFEESGKRNFTFLEESWVVNIDSGAISGSFKVPWPAPNRTPSIFGLAPADSGPAALLNRISAAFGGDDRAPELDPLPTRLGGGLPTVGKALPVSVP
ncbi:MAG: hypothetical protein ACRECR_02315 [Thermoplasmata archaeon]